MTTLPKWQSAPNYLGKEYSDYYIVLNRTRDSNSLEESNFETALSMLGGESETVIIIHSGHWAVGWIEFLAIHESDKEKLKLGETILQKLNDYPILNEEDYSNRQWEKAKYFYNNLSPEWRWKDYLHKEGISIFASRHDLYTLLQKYPDLDVYERLTADD